MPLFPAGPCPCGRDLADAADLGVTGSRQVIDVPLAAAKVTQYDSHAVACTCGRLHEAPPSADGGEAGAVTWGLNARALAVLLMVHSPRHASRTREFQSCGTARWVFPVLRNAADAASPRVGSSIYGAVQQLCLAARASGIGTSLTTLYGGHEDELRELLGLPPDALTMALIPMGYPARGRWAEPKRRPVEEVVHWNRWGATRGKP